MKRNELFYAPSKALINDDLSKFISRFEFIPNEIGHQFNDPHAVCGNRIIGDFELIYVIEGESRIVVQEHEYICHAGDVVLIPPFVLNSISTPINNPHNNYWIHFDVNPIYLQSDFISALIPNKVNKINVGIFTELLMLYKFLENEMNIQAPGGFVMFETLLKQIITFIMRKNKSGLSINKLQSMDYNAEISIVNKSLEYINNNIFEKILVGNLCEYLHISESYLYKAFKKVVSMSPSHYIQLCKIRKAEMLIKSTEFSFKEISEMLDYPSQFHFSNVFKKFYTVSPREYLYRFINAR
jgi:AraC-like DNA-binding protein